MTALPIANDGIADCQLRIANWQQAGKVLKNNRQSAIGNRK